MEHLPILLTLLLFLGFGLISKRLEGSMITPPMLFVAAGLLLSEPFLGVATFSIGDGPLHLLLEATLVLVLFSDAARIDLSGLIRDHRLPQRMLLGGMPLTIGLGTPIIYYMPLGLTWCEAALVAAILTPTDAALGQAVVSSKLVPQRIRQSLNVESGLNDGIALPIILVLASTASAIAAPEQARDWLRFAALQLTLGPASGIAIGYLGARFLNRADSAGWVSEAGRGIISLVLAALSFLLAESLGGNGFIAAFVAGLVFGHYLKRACHLFEFVETEGQLLTLGTFFVFGAVLLPHALTEFHPWYWALGLISLTVLRMLPVAVSLIGQHLHTPTTLFLGWFGPRGLASILFVLLVLHETEPPHPQIIEHIVLITVLLSVYLHGLSAAPFARKYGEAAAAWPPCKESAPVRGEESPR